MKHVKKSNKLSNVCYDIRGPVLDYAKKMEAAGETIIKLNIGNPALFGLTTSDEITNAVIAHLSDASGYVDSKGLARAREAILENSQRKNIKDVSLEDIYIGNGVSELIMMAMHALLNQGDEVLLPAPDYPLWTAAVSLAGGVARYYMCDEENDWLPALDDLQRQITANTKALVLINPNNPTGALYPVETLHAIVQIARKHHLIVYADEIYDQVLYEGAHHTAIASLADDVLFITFNGLSKNYRACGYRAGWLIISGDKQSASDYISGLNVLAAMRLCANVPAQYAIEPALTHDHSLDALLAPGGRLIQQRNLAWERLSRLPGVSCVQAKGAMYLFPKLNLQDYPIDDDQQFILELLMREKVLLVQGSGFHWKTPDHFRLVFLSNLSTLGEAMNRIERFLLYYREKHKRGAL